jgi:hypothetical protein
VTTFQTDWKGLQRIGKAFLDALPQANLEEVEKGFNCFILHYLELIPKSDNELLRAQYLVQIIGKKYIQRECLIESESHALDETCHLPSISRYK